MAQCTLKPSAALISSPSARLATALADRYRIERELGAGGMATVYLAEDLKHHREVAIKVLREDLAASMGSVRFLREIHIAAQLQHPHILPLLDSGDAEGFLYYVMPYVKGQSLRERIAREGELPIHEAVRLTIEIVDALTHAHEHGVVHRDIKPDNVMLSGRHALVTDFGVAKAISEATGRSAVTTLGVAVGTPAYMSPEQAAADPQIDHRADIYAVGVMMYELLTGQPPFTRATSQQVLAAQVSEAPDPVTRRRPGVSPALDAIVMRCLAKRPADRFQSAGELLAQLEPLATPSAGMTPSSGSQPSERGRESKRAPTARRIGLAVVAIAVVVVVGIAWWRLGGRHPGNSPAPAIAVVPFENASGDSAFDYLADGITNDLRTGLKTAFPTLSVKARSSSARAKGRTIHDAGALLHVGVVLQGTVRHSAANVTVTVELVNVSDESSMWSGKFILPPDGNFASAQDSISSAVARTLRLQPASGATTALAQRGTSNPDAYDQFLRGQYHLARNDNRGAVAFLRQAVARDPTFARAHAWLAIAYAGLPLLGVGSPDSALALAQESADRSIALDSNLVDGRLAVASIRLFQMRFIDAERELETVLKRDPDNPDLHAFLGYARGMRGDIVGELEEQRRAHTLDPLNPNPLLGEQYLLYVMGRYREAIDATRLLLDLDPNSAGAYLAMGTAYVFIGQPDSAVRAFEHAVRIDSTAYGDRVFTMFGYAAQGGWKDAERERDIVLREKRNSPNLVEALVGVTFGQYDSAAAAMDRALEHREPLILTMRWSCDPMFNPIKTHPRFVAAAQRVGAVICPATVAWPIRPPGR